MSRFIREKFLTAMRQDQFVRSRFPHFRRTTNRGDRIKWRGTLQPSPRSDLYEVEIVYEIPCRPHIQAVTPRLTTWRSEEHTSELQSQSNLVCRLLLEQKNARSLQ